MKIFIAILGSLSLFANISASHAAEPRLTWHYNAETNVIGYRLYHSPIPGIATNGASASIDVGNTNLVAMPAMTPGEPRWFAVTAYDTAGLESDFSEEIAYVVPWIRHGAIHGGTRFEFLRIKENGNLKYTLEFSEDLSTWTDQHEFTPEIVALDGGAELYRLDVPYSVAPKLFARVRVDIR